jgi:hypothetical protein
MNEWTVAAIIGALVAIAFAPSYFRSKCPACKKRKLTSVIPDEVASLRLKEIDDRKFLSFYVCEACGAKYLRERSGPYQDASHESWDFVYAEKAPV